MHAEPITFNQIAREALLHDGYLVLNELSFSEPTELRYYLEGTCIALVRYFEAEAGRSLRIAAQCPIRIVNPIDVSELIVSKTKIRFDSLVRVSSTCRILSESIRLQKASIHCSGQVSIKTNSLLMSGQSDVRLEGGETAELLVVKKICVSATSRLIVSKMQVKTKTCDLKGKLYCQGSQLIAKTLTQSGLLGCKESTVALQRYDQASSAKSVLSSSAMQSDQMSLKGDFQAKRSHLKGKTFLLSQGDLLTQKQSSLVFSKYIVMLKEAACSLSNSRIVCLNDESKTSCSIDIQASGHIRHETIFQADVITVNSNKLNISKAIIEANETCLFEGVVAIVNSKIASLQCDFNGEGSIEGSRIKSHELNVKLDNSKVSDTTMRCNRLQLQGEELSLINTKMVFSGLHVAGKITLMSGSELTGIYDHDRCHRIDGYLTLEEASLQCVGKVSSSPGSEVRLLSSDVVVPAWMCESRLLEAKEGALLTQTLLKYKGDIQAESYVLSASDAMILSAVQVNACKQSTLRAKNFYLSSGSVVKADKSYVYAQDKLLSTEGSSLTLKKSTLEAVLLSLAGQYKSAGCHVFAKNMNLMGEAEVYQSVFSVDEELTFDVSSSIVMEGSIVVPKAPKACKVCNIKGLFKSKNVFILAEKIHVPVSAEVTFSGKNILKGYALDVSGQVISGEDKENDAGLLLYMRDRVNFKRAAGVSGKNPIKIETTRFKQHGLVRLDSGMECKTSSIVNNGFMSADSLTLKADWRVLNRGSLAGKRVSVTGSFVNLLGSLDAKESINIVGPVSANLLGRISSAHYVSSAFVSLPMGLSLSNFNLNRGCLNQYTVYSMLQTMSLIFFGPSIPLLGGVVSVLGLMSSTIIGLSSAAQVTMTYAASQANYLRPHEWYPAIGAAAQVLKSAFLDFKILRNFWRTLFNPWSIPDGDRAPKGGKKKKDDETSEEEKNKNAKKEDDKNKKKEPEKPSEHPYWDAVLAKAMGVSEYWVKKGKGWMIYASSVVSNWNRYSAFTVVSPLFGVHSNNALLSMDLGLGFHSTEFDTLVLSRDSGVHVRVNGISEAVFLYNTSRRYGIEESARAVWMFHAGQTEALDNAALMATYFWNKGGSAEADNLRLELGRMDDPEKIIRGEGEWAKYKARKTFIYSSWNDLVLEEEIQRQCGLILTGYKVDFNVDYKTERVVQLNSTRGDVHIGSKVKVVGSHVGVNSANHFLNEGDVAGNTFAFRARGDVTNKGILAATKFGYIEAGGDINNLCRKRVTQGKYGKEIFYDPAYIIGGTGDGNGGPGLVMKAGGKIISDASVIASKGDNILIADEGFEFKEEHDKYIKKKHDKHSCFGLNHDYSETWSTRVFHSKVLSEHGRNILISKNGGLSAKAAVFASAEGNYADVKQDISLQGLKTKDHTYSKHGITGLETRTEQDDEFLEWTEVYDDGFSRFCSRDGDLDLSGAYVHGKGGLALIAPNGQVIFDDEVLNHHIRQSGFNAGVGIPYLSQLNDFFNGSASATSLDPTLDRLKRLSKSKKGLEWLVNGTSAGISAYNAASAIGRGAANGSLGAEALKRYGLGGEQGFSPSARLSMGWGKSERHYQTTAGCGVNRGGDLYIQAGKGVVMNHGVQVHVDGNADIDAPSIMANGVDLLSDYQSSQVGVGVNAGLKTMSPTGVGVSQSRSSGSASHYRNAVLSAGGNMKLHHGKKDMDRAVLDGARLEANSFEGGIKDLYTRDHSSSYDRKSSRVGFDSQGNVNASASSSSGSYVAQSSGIFSKEGFNTNGHHFHIHHADMEGGAIESQEEGHLDIDVVDSRPVPESHDSSSIGISFNVHDFERLSGKEPTGKPGEKAIASVDVRQDKRRYRANRLPFVGNAGVGELRGDVARTKDQILQVWANQRTSYLMSVPLTNPAYLNDARKNVAYVYRTMLHAMGSPNYIASDLAESLAFWEKQRQRLNDLLEVDFSEELVEPENNEHQHLLINGLIAAAIRSANGRFDWRFEKIMRALGKAKFKALYSKLRSMAPAAIADMALETCKEGSNGMLRAGRGALAGILGDKLTPQLLRQFYAEAADPIVGLMMAVSSILDAVTYNAARNQAWINSGRGTLASLGGRNASGFDAVENCLHAFYLMGLASWSEAFHTTHVLSEKLAQEMVDAAKSIYNVASSAKQKSEEAFGSRLGFFSSMPARGGKVAKSVGGGNLMNKQFQGAAAAGASFSNQQAAEYALSLAGITTSAAWVASVYLPDDEATYDCVQPFFMDCVNECIAREPVDPYNFHEEDAKCFRQCVEEFCVER